LPNNNCRGSHQNGGREGQKQKAYVSSHGSANAPQGGSGLAFRAEVRQRSTTLVSGKFVENFGVGIGDSPLRGSGAMRTDGYGMRA
jgi:hypothetical protein